MEFKVTFVIAKAGRFFDVKRKELGLEDFARKKQEYPSLDILGMPDYIDGFSGNPTITISPELAQETGLFDHKTHETVTFARKPKEKFHKESWIYMDGKLEVKFVADKEAILAHWKEHGYSVEL